MLFALLERSIVGRREQPWEVGRCLLRGVTWPLFAALPWIAHRLTATWFANRLKSKFKSIDFVHYLNFIRHVI